MGKTLKELARFNPSPLRVRNLWVSIPGIFIGVLGLQGHNGHAAIPRNSPSRLDEQIAPPKMGDLGLPMSSGARHGLPRGREETKARAWAQHQCLAVRAMRVQHT